MPRRVIARRHLSRMLATRFSWVSLLVLAIIWQDVDYEEVESSLWL